MGLTLRSMETKQLSTFGASDGAGTDDATFHSLLRARGDAKADALRALEQERRRIEEEIERTRRYLNDLNALLRDEGLPLVPDPTAPAKGGTPFTPGNRSTKMPSRREEFTGMPLADAVDQLLHGGRKLHADQLVSLVYDLKDDNERRAAKHSLVSALAQGVKAGRWQRAAPNVYRLAGEEEAEEGMGTN